MGFSHSKAVDNTAKVLNDIEAKLVNTALFVLLYVMVAVLIIYLLSKLYKVWHRNVKHRYVTRAQSLDLV